MKKRAKIIIFSSVTALITAAIVISVLVLDGIILLNNPSLDEYPVRGVDVSSYQGKIDWDMLSVQDIRFVYIKATEGSSSVDPNFSENYTNAVKTDLRVGAYHFFSYDSSGRTQAENFISNVPAADNMLPPAVDVEFYGDKEQNPPDADDIREELDIFLNTLEEHYSIKPVIYATGKSYDMFISDRFNEYDIWIRNVVSYPSLPDGQDWAFWQYTNRARLNGYNGEEKFIDLNVFNGTVEEFKNYCK